ncbi:MULTISPECIES: leucyl/phenylalanyl-tRNA--protein transferase [Pandoraea]|uniref:Leucyl/phenylalanyl-tRNA--protein transferase n=1 Tax=Pandoraea norimbergensis TaxID=93219 RepID=A0ABM5WP42_9BURK|nr:MULTISPECIES: leucyl/phenylalanyl-tRNA--protein transferase [Pandoraea]ALS62360.1 leucyl/phenylalanyl-tRNA--protein transferase [Pandoraea norimbergensis]
MVVWLEANDPFPPADNALSAASEAPGLLAAGLDLSPQRLLAAYHQGIFPWYSQGQPVLWWSPDPRMVLRPENFVVSHNFRKLLRRVLRDDAWEIRLDADFPAVMRACAEAPRRGQDGTWITSAIVAAYRALHDAGLAHSVETWYQGERVGGLYGVALGRMFYGESMFAKRTDASKIALAALVAFARTHAIEVIDCQQSTAHLASLGGGEISRHAFLTHVQKAVAAPAPVWHLDKQILTGLAYGNAADKAHEVLQ